MDSAFRCMKSILDFTQMSITFEATFTQFLDDLKGTFPEYTEAFTRASSLSDCRARFLTVWRTNASIIAAQDASVFTVDGIELVPGFKITSVLWSELSQQTRSVIWKYLSTLLLLAATDSTEQDKGGLWDISGFQHSMESMMAHLKGAVTAAGGAGDARDARDTTAPIEESETANIFSGLFAKLGKIAERIDLSGASSVPDFKIPERLMKGTLFKIVEELIHEFKPEDFGISPEMMESKDPRAMFEYLQEILTKKPDLLMSAGKKIAKKLQTKFANGAINREDILNEVEELMKEFSGNSAFSDLFGNIGEMLRSTERETGNDVSGRRREVQERLRKKASEKAAKRAAVDLSAAIGHVATGSTGATMDHARAIAATNELLLEAEKDNVKKVKKHKL